MGITLFVKNNRSAILFPLPKDVSQSRQVFFRFCPDYYPSLIIKKIMLLDHKALFSKEDFKYVFVLTALAWLTFTMPTMQAAMVG